MHPILAQELVAKRIAELHHQAAAERLASQLRAGHRQAGRHRRGVWERLLLRQPRPAGA